MKTKKLMMCLIGMAAVLFTGISPVGVQASADRVGFEQSYANGTEQAVITAYAEDGTVVWTRNTDSYPAAQLSSCRDIGLYNGKYYYTEGGAVYALDAADGSVIWTNTEFHGASANHFMDADGTLYVCGYYGPDLLVIDKDGNTLARIDKCRQDYNWPYEIEVAGDVIRIHYEQNGQYLELSKAETLRQPAADAEAPESGEDADGMYLKVYGPVLDAFLARNAEAGYEEFTRYGLYDIDDDGTEELFVWDDSGIENERGYVVYTCREGQAAEIGRILRDCELRGYAGCVLEKHMVPRDMSEIINRYRIEGGSLSFENLFKQPAGGEIPDSVVEWVQGTPLEFSCGLSDRSALGGTASDEDVSQEETDTGDAASREETAPAEAESQEEEAPAEAGPQEKEEPAEAVQQEPEKPEPVRLHPTAIRASTELEPYYSWDDPDLLYTYYASCVDDDNLSTAWNEGAEGDGTGEYLEFDFPAGTVLTGGVIYPGFYDYEELFYQNIAPTRIEISSGGTSVLLDVSEYAEVWQDGFQGYEFTLDPEIVSDGCVRVTILDVRLGNLYDDCCISELYFTGREAQQN